jgi:hypothetical protein
VRKNFFFFSFSFFHLEPFFFSLFLILSPRSTHHSTQPTQIKINRGKTDYDNFKGSGYAQVAISTKDVYKTAEQIRAAGGNVTREPGPVPGIGTKICATTDPDGWKVVFVDEADFLEELK